MKYIDFSRKSAFPTSRESLHILLYKVNKHLLQFIDYNNQNVSQVAAEITTFTGPEVVDDLKICPKQKRTLILFAFSTPRQIRML